MPDGGVAEAAGEKALAGKGDHSHQGGPVGTVTLGRVQAPSQLLTPEKVSRQTKSTVQSELQGEVRRGSGGSRRKPEPRKRELSRVNLSQVRVRK